MSLLRMTCGELGYLDLKVLRFNTPLTGDLVSSQTKLALHHYPVKASQQLLEMEVVFSNKEEYAAFQDFVRKHHVRAMRTVERPEVILYWPERNIDNWSGIITQLQGGDERFNIAPRASLAILLVDSMLSEKTWTSSFGEDFAKFFESSMNLPDPDDVLVPPPGQTNPNAPKEGGFYDDYLGEIIGRPGGGTPGGASGGTF